MEYFTGALLNGRNMVIVSPLRMGKSGLNEHCFDQKVIRNAYHIYDRFFGFWIANTYGTGYCL